MGANCDILGIFLKLGICSLSVPRPGHQGPAVVFKEKVLVGFLGIVGYFDSGFPVLQVLQSSYTGFERKKKLFTGVESRTPDRL